MNEGSSQLTLNIFLEKTAKGPQMFTKFNFLTTAGVMRFECQPDDTKIGKSENGESRRGRENMTVILKMRTETGGGAPHPTRSTLGPSHNLRKNTSRGTTDGVAIQGKLFPLLS